ncbi:hypothetical protein QE152_g18043 [Popillia japonica]|uniref:Uncharacterized protein n=1 Tax=Popillia japonica TaxID=7064 RepID=A0AAW1L0U7_POPJA
MAREPHRFFISPIATRPPISISTPDLDISGEWRESLIGSSFLRLFFISPIATRPCPGPERTPVPLFIAAEHHAHHKSRRNFVKKLGSFDLRRAFRTWRGDYEREKLFIAAEHHAHHKSRRNFVKKLGSFDLRRAFRTWRGDYEREKRLA